jgi:superfamily II DNA or RNA helicase
VATNKTKRTAGKAKVVQDKAPAFVGWNTTDDEEIARRRWRGLSDIVAVEPLEAAIPFFGTYRVRSASGGAYEVEIRSLTRRDNSCGCPDWQVNGLGTCKHVEGVLEWLRRKGKRAYGAAAKTGSPRLEVFPAPDGAPAVIVHRPDGWLGADVRQFLGGDNRLAGNLLDALAALRAALADGPAASVRFSRHLEARLDEERRRRRRIADREAFLADVEAGRATFDVVSHPLLPYQREGMLHLAFGERTLLADEMGLGKTVQAIAACELLRRRRGIRRVLVVLPASLKAEWEDQIARFTDLPVTIVSGPRPNRLRQYATDAFFVLVNYEQVLVDWHDINRIVAADVVVLDEAQRIKNWQTKTAQAVKSLKSPYAFVLTGTPLENRIDEVYSIVQYLDPRLLGPLFRFNRDFYVLDARGRAEDYKNLDELHRRLEPVMLRRRKDAVEDQLPSRTIDTYFVTMTEEQQLRYGDFEAPASRLIAQAQRRPLTQKEFERLQQLLACMRMVCDTPYILDPACRVSPKLDELESILSELLSEPGRKVIIFSEWERMLELVRELAVEMGLEFAWHTGSVPQDRRRLEIRRFKSDPACQLFLSTDSGSVGLNLQVASAVINMDLPWNPAKLEQRIARAWRKHQTRPVTVVNLVCENSIEHRILHLLGQKQDLADGVLDGRGDFAAIKMPSGRVAFLERLAAMMRPPEPPAAPPPAEDFGQALARTLGEGALLIERHRRPDGTPVLLAVLDGAPAEVEEQRQRLAEQAAPAGTIIETIDRATWETLRRLAAAGIISLAEGAETLHSSVRLGEDATAARQAARNRQRQAATDEAVAQAERRLRMATLLAEGGFGEEALAPMVEAVGFAVRALAISADHDLDPPDAASLAAAALAERPAVAALLPPGTIAALDAAAPIDQIRSAAQSLLAAVRG